MADPSIRHLVLVLGDQLDPDDAAWDGFDPDRDAVWMAEVEEEASHVPSHKLRIAAFFVAMRRFRDALRERGRDVRYTALTPDGREDRGRSLADVVKADARALGPEALVVTRPGDHRVLAELVDAADELGLPLEVREDRRFVCSLAEFDAWAEGRETYRLESFYRWMRRREGILMDGENPVGGRWNFDEENREAFGPDGPGELPRPPRFGLDRIARDVVELVEARWPDRPGSLDHLDLLPLSAADARAALKAFVDRRLPRFGPCQDAMWPDEPFLYHARLSVPLNLGLLSPRACVDAAVEAWEDGRAPIASVEGFVRQILGWREYVRGIYWREMPGYARRNALGADRDVPAFLWDGETEMACVADAMRSVLDHAYAHHIQRLMVLGEIALLLGVHPRRFHHWHMAMYVDAVDWVSLPNALGMSQYGDGGVVGTKPYCASGAYVDRMSPYCDGCRYDPKAATGEDACPFTTLYWDFLARNRERLAGNPRMNLQLANLKRKEGEELGAIRRRARALKWRLTRGQRI